MTGSKKRTIAEVGDSKSDVVLAIDLDDKKRVLVSKFKSHNIVDIREYYTSNGEKKPGKKGIALSMKVWEKLMESREEISAALKGLEHENNSNSESDKSNKKHHDESQSKDEQQE